MEKVGKMAKNYFRLRRYASDARLLDMYCEVDS